MASLPSTMCGVTFSKTGGSDVLEYKTDLSLPKLSDSQLLIKAEIIGVNYIDTYFRSGLYPTPNFPAILGREAVGTVVQLPSFSDANVWNVSVGDRIAAFGTTGGYASYIAVDAAKLAKVPQDISASDACAACLQALTAWTLINDTYNVKSGDTILVTAAAGGVGQWIVQMAKSKGAKVIATCSTSKVDLVKSLGADVVVDYSKGEYVGKVLEETGGQGVEAVFDSVGKDTFDQSLKCVKRKGTFASFGNASGAVPPFSIARLGEKNVLLARPRLDAYLATKEELESNVKAVWDFMIKGGIKPQIHKIYKLKDVATAHDDIESRKTTGKLLLEP
ncbi:putative quinone oxidoreductase [Microthyrium microscopicum]|uniref:Probable quinone oxidoreductase n=1 Tax=Microthyrium microscopicum TaxID=703497 RepID=A0A6A6UJH1_9PEZI|nr:putative quinone oxidoreductase [Microthyrium microscopicum]